MKLSEILKGLKFSGSFSADTEIKDIVYNSKNAADNTVFAALSGAVSDAHDYVKQAYDSGCRVFAVEHEVELPSDATVLIFKDTRSALSKMSAAFFHHPDREIKVVGVTGTNGKTTVTYMLRAAFREAGIKCGVIGTNGAVYEDVTLPTANTTPQSYETFKLLRIMADAGCEYAFLEVSSLGLKQERVSDIRFYTAVFMNISPDHVGGAEHKDLQEYMHCKQKLFSLCDYAVLNRDDPEYESFYNACRCPVKTFGINEKADYRASEISEYHNDEQFGVRFVLSADGKEMLVPVGIPGIFTVYNALAVFAVAGLCGVKPYAVRAAMGPISVEGRTQHLRIPDGAEVFIDYAHNADAIKNLLETLCKYPHRRIISLFGCVGGRAQIRRAGVGSVSGKYSDLTVITSDDASFEDPQKIADEVGAYVKAAGGECVIIPDRPKAVEYALSISHEGDFVVLMGRGHEKFQKIAGKLVPFSDREAIEKFIAGKGEANK